MLCFRCYPEKVKSKIKQYQSHVNVCESEVKGLFHVNYIPLIHNIIVYFNYVTAYTYNHPRKRLIITMVFLNKSTEKIPRSLIFLMILSTNWTSAINNPRKFNIYYQDILTCHS